MAYVILALLLSAFALRDSVSHEGADSVNALVLSPDGSRVFQATGNGQILGWDVAQVRAWAEQRARLGYEAASGNAAGSLAEDAPGRSFLQDAESPDRAAERPKSFLQVDNHAGAEPEADEPTEIPPLEDIAGTDLMPYWHPFVPKSRRAAGGPSAVAS